MISLRGTAFLNIFSNSILGRGKSKALNRKARQNDAGAISRCMWINRVVLPMMAIEKTSCKQVRTDRVEIAVGRTPPSSSRAFRDDLQAANRRY